MSKLPNMSSIDQIKMVQAAVGERIEVRPYRTGYGGDGTVSAVELCGDVAKEVLTQLGIADRDLNIFGAMVAEAALAKLALSKGFQIVYGPSEHPTHITEVDLRRPDPVVMQAPIDHFPQG